MASKVARLSKFEADFKQQSEMINKIDTFLKAINDRMTGALSSDRIKNQKLNVNPTSSVSSVCSYPMKDPQSSSHPFNSVNAIKTCFKPTNNFQKDQSQVKTLIVNNIETPKSKEPENDLEDEFKDLHPKLPVLEVLAHAPMYNTILDKYVEILELGKNGHAFIQGEMPKKMKDPRLFTLTCRLGDSKPFDTSVDLGSCMNLIPLYLFKLLNIRLLEKTKNILGLAVGTKSYLVRSVRNIEVYVEKLKLLEDFYIIHMEKDPTSPLLVGRRFLAFATTVIDCKKAKIAVGKGVTRSIFEVKEISLGYVDTPYWTTLAKQKSYESLPGMNDVGARPPYCLEKEFMDDHFPREWEIARDNELHSFKDVIVFCYQLLSSSHIDTSTRHKNIRHISTLANCNTTQIGS
nr:hypothetical protein [Tanacetum cinerariifolium]